LNLNLGFDKIQAGWSRKAFEVKGGYQFRGKDKGRWSVDTSVYW